eukprot:COSAG03_NODE_3794_length_1826_cov_777.740591_2_plen_256_part_00
MFQHAQHCQLFDDKIRTQQATERQTSRLSMPPHHSSVSTAAIDSIDSIDSQLTRMQARSQAMIAGHEQQMSLWLKPQQLQLEQQQLETMNQHLLQHQLLGQPQQPMPRPLQQEQQRHENQWNQQQQWQHTMFQHAQHRQLFDDKICTQQATERQTSRLSMPPHHSSVSTAAIDSIDSIDSQLTRMQARSQAMIARHEQQMSLWPKPQQLQLEQQQLEEMNQHLLQHQLLVLVLVLQPQQLMPRPLQQEQQRHENQ